MWMALIRWITGDLVGQLTKAYEAKLKAENDSQRIAAEMTIAKVEAALEERKLSAGVIQSGMQHKAFWIPWLIAAVPTAAWYGWGMVDSLFNGSLPDVAGLPPQLKEYADIVFANIFYVGGGVAGANILANAIKGGSRK